jgi:hypothetical protein
VTSRLFPGMIRNAIAYGHPDASDAEVEASAREDRDDRAHAEMLGRGGGHAALRAALAVDAELVA